MNEPVLQVENLTVAYRGRNRRMHTVVEGASFAIGRGRTLGLVGESGSGKTTIGRAILGLAPVINGSIKFHGDDIAHASRAARRKLAGALQVVFQDPYSSLNPAMTVGDILVEPLRATGVKEGRQHVRELLHAVGLPGDAEFRYPQAFSGGQRQRIAIARALALRPRLIVCDEPTSALDVTTQDRVLELLRKIQQDTGVSYLFVSHDLGVVREMSDEIAVLNQGKIVELGDAESVSLRPAHPYTQRLQLATPVPDPVLQRERRLRRQAAATAFEPASTGPRDASYNRVGSDGNVG